MGKATEFTGNRSVKGDDEKASVVAVSFQGHDVEINTKNKNWNLNVDVLKFELEINKGEGSGDHGREKEEGMTTRMIESVAIRGHEMDG